MHIVVENTVCLNTGDAAILLAIRHLARQAWGDDITFTIFDSQPEIAAKLYGGPNYADMKFRRLLSERIFKYPYNDTSRLNAIKPFYNRSIGQILRHAPSSLISRLPFQEDIKESLEIYRNADCVMTTGGTYLVENYNLEKRIRQFQIDAAVGQKPVFLTQSMGPFDKAYNRENLKPVLDASPLILLRDDRSKSHVLDLVDDPAKCHVVADAVFALADTDRIESILAAKENKTGTAKPSGKKRKSKKQSGGQVAVSVRHWNYVKEGSGGMGRYEEAVAAMVSWLVEEKGKEVVFLSTCQGVAEYAHDDSKTARAILSKLPAKIAGHVTVDGDFHDPDQLMALLKTFDFVISTRMHMMIMALCVGTPVLPIAYEFKTEELSKRLGIAEFLLNIDTVTAEDAVTKLERFTEGLDANRGKILQAVLDEYRSASSVVPLLSKLDLR